ncbi:MAG: hypothetical protein ACREIC_34365, partial [Limisphaerales bacterium]
MKPVCFLFTMISCAALMREVCLADPSSQSSAPPPSDASGNTAAVQPASSPSAQSGDVSMRNSAQNGGCAVVGGAGSRSTNA